MRRGLLLGHRNERDKGAGLQVVVHLEVSAAGWCITHRNERCGLVVQLEYELGVGLAEQLWFRWCFLGSYMFCFYTQTFGLIRNS